MSSSSFFVAVLALSSYAAFTNAEKQCQSPVFKEDINWDLLNDGGPWYDVFDIPGSATPVDCWNWVSFESAENGGVATIKQWVYGGDGKEHQMLNYFVKKDEKKGIYELHEHLREHFGDVLHNALEHKGTTTEEINEIVETQYPAEYFILTDYHHYFILASCLGDKGLTVFIKLNKQKPDLEDVVRVWNAMTERGLSGKIQIKDKCISRSYGDGC